MEPSEDIKKSRRTCGEAAAQEWVLQDRTGVEDLCDKKTINSVNGNWLYNRKDYQIFEVLWILVLSEQVCILRIWVVPRIMYSF